MLIARLTALRHRIRRRLVVYGVFVVITNGVAAMLSVITLDWLLGLPPVPRLCLGIIFLVGFALATTYWIVRPIRTDIELHGVAARLENHFGSLRDRLTTTVEFLQHDEQGSSPTPMSPTMMQQVVANTERITRDTPLESALSMTPLVLRGVVATCVVAVFALVTYASPGWVSTGVARYVYPWGALQWPRTVEIQALTADQIIAVGESVTVRMEILRGLDETLRGVVHVRQPDGTAVAQTMQRDEPGRSATFHATIDSVTRNLEYWFEAGDANTLAHPAKIGVTRRPEVVEALAIVEPPAYASQREAIVRDLSEGPVRAVVGGFVTVAVRSSKPLPASSNIEQLNLDRDGTPWVALAVDDEDRHKLTARFEISDDVGFRVHLTDEHGFSNRGGAEFAIDAVNDRPPSVAVLEPTAVTEVTPRGSVALLVRVRDDLGITRIELASQLVGGEAQPRVTMPDWTEQVDEDNEIEATARYQWNLESAAFVPGDVVIYRAVATDNRLADGVTEQEGQSATLRLRVISEVEFEIRMRSELARLEARIRQIALDEEELLDHTVELVRPKREAADDVSPNEPPGAWTARQRDWLTTLSGRQSRLGTRVRETVGRLSDMVERRHKNHVGDQAARERIAVISEELQQTASESMTAAGSALEESRESDLEEDQQVAIRQAVTAEERTLERLHDIIRSMTQWGDFRELLTKSRDLRDRQDELQQRTSALGKAILGQPVETLDEADADQLKRLGREQEQLRADVDDLLNRMTAVASIAQEKDPSTTEAIDDALRAARAHDVMQHLDDAVSGIGKNRTAAAGVAQKSAAHAMHKMIDALKQRETRELQELYKQLQEAQDQVAFLIQQQEDLRDATVESGAMGATKEETDRLSEQQHRLERNTRLLGEELGSVDRTVIAGAKVRQAATPMRQAYRRLAEGGEKHAVVAQEEALAMLHDALERLEQAALAAADESLRRSLGDIRDGLEAIVAAQHEVNDGVDELHDSVETGKRLGRAANRMAARLARKQLDVRSMVDQRAADFEQVVVYRWALSRAVQWMDDSTDRLNERTIDDELIRLTRRIVRELETLINAIDRTQGLTSDDEFTQGSSSGGSGRSATSTERPVPTVAELFVLKTMQIDIRKRTVGLAESGHAAASESQLDELRLLGEDQARLRQLTIMIVKQAERGSP